MKTKQRYVVRTWNSHSHGIVDLFRGQIIAWRCRLNAAARRAQQLNQDYARL